MILAYCCGFTIGSPITGVNEVLGNISDREETAAYGKNNFIIILKMD